MTTLPSDTKGALSINRSRKTPNRSGVRVNAYISTDADAILNNLAEAWGCTKTDVIERITYDAHFLHEAQEDGDRLLLFNKKNEIPYREVALFSRRMASKR